MLAKINQGQLVLLNIKKSFKDFRKYFKENSTNKKGYGYFISLKNMIIDGDYDKKGGFIIKSIRFLTDIFKSIKKEINNKTDKEIKTKIITINPLTKNVLWVSRHNMLTKAYLDLQKMYPKHVINVYPCQPRVLEGKTIYELAEKYNCDTICAILSDNIFIDLINDIRSIKCTILKPIIYIKETNANISPLHSIKILKQKEWIFNNWYDVKSKENILFNE